jgi:hypothetical protein
MTIDKAKIEARITENCPLPLTFFWDDKEDGNALLQIAVPVDTQAGRPVVIVAFPVGMPAPYLPKVIARAKALIGEIFDANMVGIVFTGPRAGIVKPQKALLLPGSAMAGSA